MNEIFPYAFSPDGFKMTPLGMEARADDFDEVADTLPPVPSAILHSVADLIRANIP